MTDFHTTAPSSKISTMGHNIDVAAIYRNGEVIFINDILNNLPKDHLAGNVLEITFETKLGNPYFVYYFCDEYYYATVSFASAKLFGGPQKTAQFRALASQEIAKFLILYLYHQLGIDSRSDITSFSHNRSHTNVLCYIESLKNWFSIQHSDAESEDASKRKIELVNSGKASINQFIATTHPSPHG